MTLTIGELMGWVGSYLWPLFRIGAFLMVAPITGAASVPARARLGLALLITLLIAPLLPPGPVVDPFGWDSLAIIFQQVLIGIAMGLVLQLVFQAIITGGQVVAMQMGLGFASMVDPQNGQQVPVLSQFYLLMATLLFLVFNGHLVMFELVSESFQALPVANDGIVRADLWEIVSWAGTMFSGAVWLAIPAVASLLIVNVSFGVMARAAPQLNIFAIGFPVAMMTGFVVILLVLPSLVTQFSVLADEGFGLLRRILFGGG